MELQIHREEELKPLPDGSEVTFGSTFSDHMFNMDDDQDK